MSNFERKWHNDVASFRQNSLQSFALQTSDGLRLHCNFAINTASRRSIILLTGYSEPSLKYQELIFDFFQKGFSVFALDHRGMGESERMLKNPQIVHVRDFSDYTNDLDQFIVTITQRFYHQTENLFLFAHSTGALIASLFLSQNPNSKTIKACAFSAPFFTLNTKGYWHYGFYSFLSFMNRVGLGARFVPGFTEYDPRVIDPVNQEETSCVERFSAWRESMIHFFPAWMGGPSIHWLVNALKYTESPKIKKLAETISTQTLIFSAGNDNYVDNFGINLFCTTNKNATRIHFPNSKHAIWMENDFIRNRMLDATVEHFSTHQSMIEGKTSQLP